MKLRHVLYMIIAVPVFVVLVWFFAVPTSLIEDRILDAVSEAGGARLRADITGLRKGVLLGLHADAVELHENDKPALNITDLSIRLNPKLILDKKLAFNLRGKIGTGRLNGVVSMPPSGDIFVEDAELEAIPYLQQLGIAVNGHVSSDIHILHDTIDVLFEVPDLNIGGGNAVIPLLNTFRKLQGAMSVRENRISVKSISLDGDKGYARLKGDIINGFMDLSLELMPITDKLNAMESMLIGKYIISPGYYVIPVKGRML